LKLAVRRCRSTRALPPPAWDRAKRRGEPLLFITAIAAPPKTTAEADRAITSRENSVGCNKARTSSVPVGIALVGRLAAGACGGTTNRSHHSGIPAEEEDSTFVTLQSKLGAPDPAPDPDANTLNASLLSLIPGDIQSGNTCSSYGTPLGSVAAIECSGVQGLSAGTFYYYLFANVSALNQGYSSFLQDASFPYSCSASDGGFASFITSCQSHYSNNSPVISGTISEYLNSNNYPVIACTDDQHLVMVVMVGANGGDLLAFWNNLGWIVTSG
jgi:hypothetical protein